MMYVHYRIYCSTHGPLKGVPCALGVVVFAECPVGAIPEHTLDL